jgi:MFS transporter, ACS family, tartrate transporter
LTTRKLAARLLPFLLGLYIVAFIDRINLGFAALTMNRELAITSQQFGFAAGIFFLGYFVFEVPSNLILHRIGARVWMARILITWGVIATLTGFVQSPRQLYVARFALGVAEAGYFPGIVHYLGYWFRQREKALAIAVIIMGIPLASIIGAPASGLILDHVHWLGLSSWRWLFVLEGFPAVIGALMAGVVLPSRPEDAAFLSAEEKRGVIEGIAEEDRGKRPVSVVQALVNPRVLLLAAMGFCHAFGQYTFNFWMPQILKSALGGVSNTMVGLLVAVPNLLGLAAMIVVCRHSDRTMERRYHMVISIALGGIALVFLGVPRSPIETVMLFSLAAIGAYCFLPIFFTVPGAFLTGYSAAAGIALIASVSNLGGLAGPWVVGEIHQRGLVIAGVLYLVSAVLALRTIP